MRNLKLTSPNRVFWCALALTALLPLPGQAGNDTVVVVMDQARVVKVPDNTTTLVVGNPGIADVALLKNNNTMIITGKGFGETNMIALDKNGSPVAESTLRVVNGASTNMVVLQRGTERMSYSCAPRCEPTVTLGDTTKYVNDGIELSKARENFAKPQR